MTALLVWFQYIQKVEKATLHIATLLHDCIATEAPIAAKPQRIPQRGGGQRPPPVVEAARDSLFCGYVAMCLCGSVAM